MPKLSYIARVWAEGKENLGGLLGNLFFIPKSALDLSALTVDADGVTIVGDIAVQDALTQGAVEIYATEDTIQLTDTQGGSIDGETTTVTLIWVFPGSTKESASLKRQLTVTDGIYLAKDTEGNWRIVGLTLIEDPATPGTFSVNSDIQARVTAKEGTHGNRADNRKGTTFTVTYVSLHEAPFYSGAIPALP